MKLLIILGLAITLATAGAEKSKSEKKLAVTEKLLRTIGYPKDIDIKCELCLALMEVINDDSDISSAAEDVHEFCDDLIIIVDDICNAIAGKLMDAIAGLVDDVTDPRDVCEAVDFC